MRSFLERAAVVGIATMLAAGCGEPSTTATGPCTGPVTVTIEGTGPFIIDWSPACGVAQLSVATPPSVGFGPSWAIRSSTSGIFPRVEYGKVPSGAEETLPSSGIILSGSLLSVQLRDAGGQVLGSAGLRVP